jgi:hypothetical protein
MKVLIETHINNDLSERRVSLLTAQRRALLHVSQPHEWAMLRTASNIKATILSRPEGDFLCRGEDCSVEVCGYNGRIARVI